MLNIWAMYWKECKELFFQRNRQLLMCLLVVVLLGVWLPYQIGHVWLQLPLIAILSLVIGPALEVIVSVADSFAGERERHTLESLLATSLSDVSIVAGKVAALLTMAWGMTMTGILVGFVVANMQTPGYAWSFYPLDRLLITVLLSLTFSVLIIAIGILISLHAATVRQAQQTLGSGLAGLGLAGAILSSQLAHLPFVESLRGLGDGEAFAWTIGCIVLLDAVLILLILVRFQRSRLIQG